MANVWREPIFDRTLEDVEFAIQKIAEWKKNHTHSTDVRVKKDVSIVEVGDVYDLKGCLNLVDLNRIEGNIGYLAEKMESFAYSPNIHIKQWGKADMPNQNDMSRIIENIRALMNAFYSPANPRLLPSTMLTYLDINAIEENLYLIKELLDWMQSSFKKVGTIKSGSATFLPIRR